MFYKHFWSEMLTVRGQQHSFSTHERMFLWKCQSFWDRKCLDLRGIRTPDLRIQAQCSNHMSYHGQTFAVPCFRTRHQRFPLQRTSNECAKRFHVMTSSMNYPFCALVNSSPPPPDKMDAISQTPFRNTFLLMKSFVFLFEFHWILLLRARMTIRQHWFR